MPTFIQGKKRNPWKGQVKRSGFTPVAQYFPTQEEAIAFEDKTRDKWNRLARGELAYDPNDLRKVTIGAFIDLYLKKETPKKASHVEETYRLEIFRNWNNIADRPLNAFNRYDVLEFIEYLTNEYQFIGKPYIVKTGKLKGKTITPKRKPKSVKPGTILRLVGILRNMWNVAALNWRGYESLQGRNPWANIEPSKSNKIIKTPKRRTRRLNDLPNRKNELERILEACNRCVGINVIYMKLGINLAVQTGMRLQEILNLRWNDIDLEERKINIRKSKTDHTSDDDGREIALPTRCLMYLVETAIIMRHMREKHITFELNETIFTINSESFKQAWKRVTEWACIPSKEEDMEKGVKESQRGLEFRDLRREAGSRFDEIPLSKKEHDIMLGHADKEMRGTYVAPFLKSIREKLDVYWDDATKYQDTVYKTGVEKGLSTEDILAQSAINTMGEKNTNELMQKILDRDPNLKERLNRQVRESAIKIIGRERLLKYGIVISETRQETSQETKPSNVVQLKR